MWQTTKEIYITIFLQSFIWKLKCASMLWFILGIFKLLIPRVELIELTFSSIRLMLFFNFCICHLHHLHCLGEAKLLKDNSTKTTISVRRGNILCYSIVFSSNWTLPYCWSMYASCHIYSIFEVLDRCAFVILKVQILWRGVLWHPFILICQFHFYGEIRLMPNRIISTNKHCKGSSELLRYI